MITVDIAPPPRLVYLSHIPVGEALLAELNSVTTKMYTKFAIHGVLPSSEELDELTYLHCARVVVRQSLRR